MHDYLFIKAKRDAIQYILFKRRSEYQVRQKLEQKGHDECIINNVITYLKQLEYIDDIIYTEKFIKQAVEFKKYGKHRISLELRKSGIADNLIERFISAVNIDEKQVLYPLIKRKLEPLQEYDEKALNRVRSHFYRKGYNLNVINECICDYMAETSSED